MKAKLKGAQTGHDLLKRKSEALTKYVNPSFGNNSATNVILSQTLSRCVTQPYPPVILILNNLQKSQDELTRPSGRWDE
jgi:hypothetical protein